MPILSPDVSQEAVDLVSSTLRDLAGRSGLITTRLRGASPAELAFTMPHSAYVLTLEGVAEHQRLNAAAEVAVRVMVKRGNEVVAGAGAVPKGGFYIFSGINEGPFVQSTVKGFQRASELHEVQVGKYQARLLSVPALDTVALWLKDQQGSEDRVLPLEPALVVYLPYHAYEEEEFFKLLLAAAQERLAERPAGPNDGGGPVAPLP